MKRVLLIINPCAGKMKAKTALFDMVSVLSAAGYYVTVRITDHPGHAAELAQEAEALGMDYIVCSGGDGTLNEVISGVRKNSTLIPVGYIPTGSTNDFANGMNIPSDVKKATEAFVNGKTFDLDIGLFNGREFTYVASFGAFTAVSYRAKQPMKNVFGHLAYLLEGVNDLASIRPYSVKATADGQVFEGEYIFGAITNSTSIGGIVKLDEDLVSVSDGLFEMILIQMPKNPVELTQIIYGLTNSDFSDPIFHFQRASHFSLELSSDIPWSLDGEYAEGKETVEVQVLKREIQLLK